MTVSERIDDDSVAGQDWITKDSGEREEYNSGMQRDVQTGKPRFDLLLTDLPYEAQFLTRFARLLDRGASKYGERNWQLANSTEELDRFRASALRHATQWATGERDEDHAAAVAFNLMAYEYVKWKLENAQESSPEEREDSSSGDPIEQSVPGDGQASGTATRGFLRGLGYTLQPNSTMVFDQSGDCDECIPKGTDPRANWQV